MENMTYKLTDFEGPLDLLIALIDLAFPYLSRWCMYELLPQNAYRTFFTVMAVAAAAFAVRGVLTYIIGYYGHTFGILVEADIRRDLFRHMQELDFGYYDRRFDEPPDQRAV